MARLVLSRAFWLLLGAAVMIFVVAGGWLSRVQPPPALPETPPPRADFYLRDADIEVMDAEGRLSYRVHTAELLRYNDMSSRLAKVRIEALGGREGVWQLEAEEALISRHREQLLLRGDVRMRTEGPGGATLLTTDTLTVAIKDRRLTTADPVTIVGPEFQTRAVGMQADFRNRDLTLLNQVRSHYAP
ncbi:MAG TPA: LPS export ABC transporter periplasmic protein LptC [Nevskiales bacterium]|nr:LPS export ABC transporter periplasmic protein LptC [Nevskiales bacterium]